MNIPTLEKPYHYDGGNYYEKPDDYQQTIQKFINNTISKEK